MSVASEDASNSYSALLQQYILFGHLHTENCDACRWPAGCRSPGMACRYCGLPTEAGANHGGSGECVAALKAEAERLLKRIGTTVRLPKPALDTSLDVQHVSAPAQNPSSSDIVEDDGGAPDANETP